MKVFDRSGGARERQILAAMITSDAVVGRVAAQWHDDGPFDARPANVVGTLCVEHFRRHGCAPQGGVRALFEGWADTTRDEDTITLAEKLLEAVVGDEHPANPSLALDLAGAHFEEVAMRRLIREMEAELDAGRRLKAREKYDTFRRPEIGIAAGTDVLNDREALAAAFAPEAREVMVYYPGALGQFFGRDLSRGQFVVFTAPEKSGKSYWLLDVAWRAIHQRRRVAYFQVGDLTESEVYERIAVRAARAPLYPEAVDWPTSLRVEDGEAVADHEQITYDDPLGEEEVWKAFQKTALKRVKSRKPYFRLSVHPNCTLDVNGMRSILAGWERDGWSADVLVVDYMEMLAAPPVFEKDFRQQTNVSWVKMRSLSQELHCLVVSATQADAESYDAKLMSRRNFSEDKRKHAHITACYGINVTAREKELGTCRLNHLQRRGQKSNWKRTVSVAGCLSLARPAVLSTF